MSHIKRSIPSVTAALLLAVASGSLAARHSVRAETGPWETLPWGRDVAGAQAACHDIDSISQAKAITAELTVATRRAEAAQSDRLTCIRYGYAVFRAYVIDPSKLDAATVRRALAAIRSARPPYDYWYVRTRFLLEAMVEERLPTRAGERLLARNARDVQVMFCLVRMLVRTMSRPDADKAVRYSEQLARAAPGDPAMWGLLGDAYLARAYFENEPGSLRSALGAYNHALAVAPDGNSAIAICKAHVRLVKLALKRRYGISTPDGPTRAR